MLEVRSDTMATCLSSPLCAHKYVYLLLVILPFTFCFFSVIRQFQTVLGGAMTTERV
eukprot:m.370596 g.370596  ORF g.370596 m.370596 type:complete len:57 (+) comp54743_c0_seq1:195-365(+)